jgi:hypothetical protein
MTSEPNSLPAEKKNSGKTWLKRIGVAGFLFFLIKGLLWLVMFALVFFGVFDQEVVDRLSDWFPF